MPKNWASYLVKVFLTTFLDNERIVRIIYSEQNINPRNKTLKNNFFKFDLNSETNKLELSCLRFELESISFCRKFGKATENPLYKRNYYGLGCTLPRFVNELDQYEFKFSPILNSDPKNYFHCDIYDNFGYNIEIGEAKSAEINYRIEKLKEKWKVNEDKDGVLKDEDVISL